MTPHIFAIALAASVLATAPPVIAKNAVVARPSAARAAASASAARAYQAFVAALRAGDWAAVRTFVDTEARTDEAAADLVDAYIAFAKELGAELPALHPAAIDKVEVAGDGAKLAAFIRLVAVDPVPEHMSPRFTALAFSRDGGRTWTVSIVDCRPKEILREFLPAWNGSPAL